MSTQSNSDKTELNLPRLTDRETVSPSELLSKPAQSNHLRDGRIRINPQPTQSNHSSTENLQIRSKIGSPCSRNRCAWAAPEPAARTAPSGEAIVVSRLQGLLVLESDQIQLPKLRLRPSVPSPASQLGCDGHIHVWGYALIRHHRVVLH